MRAPRAASGGFVLVGVVMFVLALTILGLSLYALSSYEAVFLGQTHDSNAALYRAQGGLAMCSSILEEASRLDTLRALQPFPASTGIVHAYAYKTSPADSSGPFNAGDIITLVVTAGQGDAERVVSARYVAGGNLDPYKRLFTVGPGGVDVDDEGPTFASAVRTIYVGNPASGTLSAQPDSAWRDTITWLPFPRPPFRSTTLPALDVSGFRAAHPQASAFTPVQTPPAGSPPTTTLTFDQHASGIGLYYGPVTTATYPGWTFRAFNAGATLKVKGTAIWILPGGLRSDYAITVQPTVTASATLVIVGSPMSPPRSPAATLGPVDVGIYSLGGLNVPGNDVNVILVSDGAIELRQLLQFTASLNASHLSISCNRLRLLGPSFGAARSYLDYDSSMDALIASLESVGALPAATGGTPAHFQFIAGSWKDLTP